VLAGSLTAAQEVLRGNEKALQQSALKVEKATKAAMAHEVRAEKALARQEAAQAEATAAYEDAARLQQEKEALEEALAATDKRHETLGAPEANVLLAMQLSNAEKSLREKDSQLQTALQSESDARKALTTKEVEAERALARQDAAEAEAASAFSDATALEQEKAGLEEALERAERLRHDESTDMAVELSYQLAGAEKSLRETEKLLEKATKSESESLRAAAGAKVEQERATARLEAAESALEASQQMKQTTQASAPMEDPLGVFGGDSAALRAKLAGVERELALSKAEVAHLSEEMFRLEDSIWDRQLVESSGDTAEPSAAGALADNLNQLRAAAESNSRLERRVRQLTQSKDAAEDAAGKAELYVAEMLENESRMQYIQEQSLGQSRANAVTAVQSTLDMEQSVADAAKGNAAREVELEKAIARQRAAEEEAASSQHEVARLKHEVALLEEAVEQAALVQQLIDGEETDSAIGELAAKLYAADEAARAQAKELQKAGQAEAVAKKGVAQLQVEFERAMAMQEAAAVDLAVVKKELDAAKQGKARLEGALHDASEKMAKAVQDALRAHGTDVDVAADLSYELAASGKKLREKDDELHQLTQALTDAQQAMAAKTVGLERATARQEAAEVEAASALRDADLLQQQNARLEGALATAQAKMHDAIENAAAKGAEDMAIELSYQLAAAEKDLRDKEGEFAKLAQELAEAKKSIAAKEVEAERAVARREAAQEAQAHLEQELELEKLEAMRLRRELLEANMSKDDSKHKTKHSSVMKATIAKELEQEVARLEKETAVLQKAKLAEAKKKIMEGEARKAEAAREVEAEKAVAERAAHELEVSQLKNELTLSKGEVARLEEALVKTGELQQSMQGAANDGADAMVDLSYRLAAAEKDIREKDRELEKAGQVHADAKKAFSFQEVEAERALARQNAAEAEANASKKEVAMSRQEVVRLEEATAKAVATSEGAVDADHRLLAERLSEAEKALRGKDKELDAAAHAEGDWQKAEAVLQVELERAQARQVASEAEAEGHKAGIALLSGEVARLEASLSVAEAVHESVGAVEGSEELASQLQKASQALREREGELQRVIQSEQDARRLTTANAVEAERATARQEAAEAEAARATEDAAALQHEKEGLEAALANSAEKLHKAVEAAARQGGPTDVDMAIELSYQLAAAEKDLRGKEGEFAKLAQELAEAKKSIAAKEVAAERARARQAVAEEDAQLAYQDVSSLQDKVNRLEEAGKQATELQQQLSQQGTVADPNVLLTLQLNAAQKVAMDAQDELADAKTAQDAAVQSAAGNQLEADKAESRQLAAEADAASLQRELVNSRNEVGRLEESLQHAYSQQAGGSQMDEELGLAVQLAEVQKKLREKEKALDEAAVREAAARSAVGAMAIEVGRAVARQEAAQASEKAVVRHLEASGVPVPARSAVVRSGEGASQEQTDRVQSLQVENRVLKQHLLDMRKQPATPNTSLEVDTATAADDGRDWLSERLAKAESSLRRVEQENDMLREQIRGSRGGGGPGPAGVDVPLQAAMTPAYAASGAGGEGWKVPTYQLLEPPLRVQSGDRDWLTSRLAKAEEYIREHMESYHDGPGAGGGGASLAQALLEKDQAQEASRKLQASKDVEGERANQRTKAAQEDAAAAAQEAERLRKEVQRLQDALDKAALDYQSVLGANADEAQAALAARLSSLEGAMREKDRALDAAKNGEDDAKRTAAVQSVNCERAQGQAKLADAEAAALRQEVVLLKQDVDRLEVALDESTQPPTGGNDHVDMAVELSYQVAKSEKALRNMKKELAKALQETAAAHSASVGKDVEIERAGLKKTAAEEEAATAKNELALSRSEARRLEDALRKETAQKEAALRMHKETMERQIAAKKRQENQAATSAASKVPALRDPLDEGFKAPFDPLDAGFERDSDSDEEAKPADKAAMMLEDPLGMFSTGPEAGSIDLATELSIQLAEAEKSLREIQGELETKAQEETDQRKSNASQQDELEKALARQQAAVEDAEHAKQEALSLRQENAHLEVALENAEGRVHEAVAANAAAAANADDTNDTAIELSYKLAAAEKALRDKEKEITQVALSGAEARKAAAAKEVEAQKALARQQAAEEESASIKQDATRATQEVARLEAAVGDAEEKLHAAVAQSSRGPGEDGTMAVQLSYKLAAAEKAFRVKQKETEEAKATGAEASKTALVKEIEAERARARQEAAEADLTSSRHEVALLRQDVAHLDEALKSKNETQKLKEQSEHSNAVNTMAMKLLVAEEGMRQKEKELQRAEQSGSEAKKAVAAKEVEAEMANAREQATAAELSTTLKKEAAQEEEISLLKAALSKAAADCVETVKAVKEGDAELAANLTAKLTDAQFALHDTETQLRGSMQAEDTLKKDVAAKAAEAERALARQKAAEQEAAVEAQEISLLKEGMAQLKEAVEQAKHVQQLIDEESNEEALNQLHAKLSDAEASLREKDALFQKVTQSEAETRKAVAGAEAEAERAKARQDAAEHALDAFEEESRLAHDEPSSKGPGKDSEEGEDAMNDLDLLEAIHQDVNEAMQEMDQMSADEAPEEEPMLDAEGELNPNWKRPIREALEEDEDGKPFKTESQYEELMRLRAEVVELRLRLYEKAASGASHEKTKHSSIMKAVIAREVERLEQEAEKEIKRRVKTGKKAAYKALEAEAELANAHAEQADAELLEKTKEAKLLFKELQRLKAEAEKAAKERTAGLEKRIDEADSSTTDVDLAKELSTHLAGAEKDLRDKTLELNSAQQTSTDAKKAAASNAVDAERALALREAAEAELLQARKQVKLLQEENRRLQAALEDTHSLKHALGEADTPEAANALLAEELALAKAELRSKDKAWAEASMEEAELKKLVIHKEVEAEKAVAMQQAAEADAAKVRKELSISLDAVSRLEIECKKEDTVPEPSPRLETVKSQLKAAKETAHENDVELARASDSLKEARKAAAGKEVEAEKALARQMKAEADAEAAQMMVALQKQELERLEGAMRETRDADPINAARSGLHRMKPMEKMTEEDRKEAVELFHVCDADNDGKVNHEELKAYLTAAPWALSYVGAAGFEWQELWNDYDADRDGHLSQPEFLSLYTEKLHPLVSLARTATGDAVRAKEKEHDAKLAAEVGAQANLLKAAKSEAAERALAKERAAEKEAHCLKQELELRDRKVSQLEADIAKASQMQILIAHEAGDTAAATIAGQLAVAEEAVRTKDAAVALAVQLKHNAETKAAEKENEAAIELARRESVERELCEMQDRVAELEGAVFKADPAFEPPGAAIPALQMPGLAQGQSLAAEGKLTPRLTPRSEAAAAMAKQLEEDLHGDGAFNAIGAMALLRENDALLRDSESFQEIIGSETAMRKAVEAENETLKALLGDDALAQLNETAVDTAEDADAGSSGGDLAEKASPRQLRKTDATQILLALSTAQAALVEMPEGPDKEEMRATVAHLEGMLAIEGNIDTTKRPTGGGGGGGGGGGAGEGKPADPLDVMFDGMDEEDDEDRPGGGGGGGGGSGGGGGGGADAEGFSTPATKPPRLPSSPDGPEEEQRSAILKRLLADEKLSKAELEKRFALAHEEFQTGRDWLTERLANAEDALRQLGHLDGGVAFHNSLLAESPGSPEVHDLTLKLAEADAAHGIVKTERDWLTERLAASEDTQRHLEAKLAALEGQVPDGAGLMSSATGGDGLVDAEGNLREDWTRSTTVQSVEGAEGAAAPAKKAEMLAHWASMREVLMEGRNIRLGLAAENAASRREADAILEELPDESKLRLEAGEAAARQEAAEAALEAANAEAELLRQGMARLEKAVAAATAMPATEDPEGRLAAAEAALRAKDQEVDRALQAEQTAKELAAVKDAAVEVAVRRQEAAEFSAKESAQEAERSKKEVFRLEEAKAKAMETKQLLDAQDTDGAVAKMSVELSLTEKALRQTHYQLEAARDSNAAMLEALGKNEEEASKALARVQVAEADNAQLKGDVEVEWKAVQRLGSELDQALEIRELVSESTEAEALVRLAEELKDAQKKNREHQKQVDMWGEYHRLASIKEASGGAKVQQAEVRQKAAEEEAATAKATLAGMEQAIVEAAEAKAEAAFVMHEFETLKALVPGSPIADPRPPLPRQALPESEAVVAEKLTAAEDTIQWLLENAPFSIDGQEHELSPTKAALVARLGQSKSTAAGGRVRLKPAASSSGSEEENYSYLSQFAEADTYAAREELKEVRKLLTLKEVELERAAEKTIGVAEDASAARQELRLGQQEIARLQTEIESAMELAREGKTSDTREILGRLEAAESAVRLKDGLLDRACVEQERLQLKLNLEQAEAELAASRWEAAQAAQDDAARKLAAVTAKLGEMEVRLGPNPLQSFGNPLFSTEDEEGEEAPEQGYVAALATALADTDDALKGKTAEWEEAVAGRAEARQAMASKEIEVERALARQTAAEGEAQAAQNKARLLQEDVKRLEEALLESFTPAMDLSGGDPLDVFFSEEKLQEATQSQSKPDFRSSSSPLPSFKKTWSAIKSHALKVAQDAGEAAAKAGASTDDAASIAAEAAGAAVQEAGGSAVDAARASGEAVKQLGGSSQTHVAAVGATAGAAVAREGGSAEEASAAAKEAAVASGATAEEAEQAAGKAAGKAAAHSAVVADLKQRMKTAADRASILRERFLEVRKKDKALQVSQLAEADAKKVAAAKGAVADIAQARQKVAESDANVARSEVERLKQEVFRLERAAAAVASRQDPVNVDAAAQAAPSAPPPSRANEEARALFAEADTDASGLLTSEELQRYLYAKPWSMSYLGGEGFNWSELWARYDTDGDDRLDQGEFVALYATELAPLLQIAQKAAGGAVRAKEKELDFMAQSEAKAKKVSLEAELDAERASARQRAAEGEAAAARKELELKMQEVIRLEEAVTQSQMSQKVMHESSSDQAAASIFTKLSAAEDALREKSKAADRDAQAAETMKQLAVEKEAEAGEATARQAAAEAETATSRACLASLQVEVTALEQALARSQEETASVLRGSGAPDVELAVGLSYRLGELEKEVRNTGKELQEALQVVEEARRTASNSEVQAARAEARQQLAEQEAAQAFQDATLLQQDNERLKQAHAVLDENDPARANQVLVDKLAAAGAELQQKEKQLQELQAAGAAKAEDPVNRALSAQLALQERSLTAKQTELEDKERERYAAEENAAALRDELATMLEQDVNRLASEASSIQGSPQALAESSPDPATESEQDPAAVLSLQLQGAQQQIRARDLEIERLQQQLQRMEHDTIDLAEQAALAAVLPPASSSVDFELTMQLANAKEEATTTAMALLAAEEELRSLQAQLQAASSGGNSAKTASPMSRAQDTQASSPSNTGSPGTPGSPLEAKLDSMRYAMQQAYAEASVLKYANLKLKDEVHFLEDKLCSAVEEDQPTPGGRVDDPEAVWRQAVEDARQDLHTASPSPMEMDDVGQHRLQQCLTVLDTLRQMITALSGEPGAPDLAGIEVDRDSVRQWPSTTSWDQALNEIYSELSHLKLRGLQQLLRADKDAVHRVGPRS